MTFAEAPGRGSLQGVSVSPSSDTASHAAHMPDRESRAGALCSPGLARGLCEALAMLQRPRGAGTALLGLVGWWERESDSDMRKTPSRGGTDAAE